MGPSRDSSKLVEIHDKQFIVIGKSLRSEVRTSASAFSLLNGSSSISVGSGAWTTATGVSILSNVVEGENVDVDELESELLIDEDPIAASEVIRSQQ